MTESKSPDAIYWRRLRHGEPEIEYCELENVWFWPGEGPCVDGYYYWIPKKRPTLAKRVPLEIWRMWGRRKHSPSDLLFFFGLLLLVGTMFNLLQIIWGIYGVILIMIACLSRLGLT